MNRDLPSSQRHNINVQPGDKMTILLEDCIIITSVADVRSRTSTCDASASNSERDACCGSASNHTRSTPEPNGTPTIIAEGSKRIAR